MVWESYLTVVSKQGGAGIDRESIEMFNANMSANLYKLWNRMTSGSYFPPPVRTVFIPNKQGGLRPLGIPTVSDRIAQGVVKDYLEPSMEAIFHNNPLQLHGKLCQYPEVYRYSSAKFYEKGIGEFAFLSHYFG